MTKQIEYIESGKQAAELFEASFVSFHKSIEAEKLGENINNGENLVMSQQHREEGKVLLDASIQGYGEFIHLLATNEEILTQREGDAPNQVYFSQSTAIAQVVIGATVVVAGLALVPLTGGTSLAAAGSIVSTIAVAGGASVAMVGIRDLQRGVNTAGKEVCSIVATDVIIALFSFGLSKIMVPSALPCTFGKALKYTLMNGVSGFVLGTAESAIRDIVRLQD